MPAAPPEPCDSVRIRRTLFALGWGWAVNHAEATRLAAESKCVLCHDTPCEPCHWPTHRGMGGAKAGWERREWVPLCRYHHTLIDKTQGVSKAKEFERSLAIQIIREEREDGVPRPGGGGT